MRWIAVIVKYLLIIWDLICVELWWTSWWSHGLSTVSKENHLENRVRTANKSTYTSKLSLSLSSEVSSPDQVKFSSACPVQNKCCERTFHTALHSTPHLQPKKERIPALLTLTKALSNRFWFFQGETAGKMWFKWRWPRVLCAACLDTWFEERCSRQYGFKRVQWGTKS